MLPSSVPADVLLHPSAKRLDVHCQHRRSGVTAAPGVATHYRRYDCYHVRPRLGRPIRRHPIRHYRPARITRAHRRRPLRLRAKHGRAVRRAIPTRNTQVGRQFEYRPIPQSRRRRHMTRTSLGHPKPQRVQSPPNLGPARTPPIDAQRPYATIAQLASMRQTTQCNQRDIRGEMCTLKRAMRINPRHISHKRRLRRLQCRTSQIRHMRRASQAAVCRRQHVFPCDQHPTAHQFIRSTYRPKPYKRRHRLRRLHRRTPVNRIHTATAAHRHHQRHRQRHRHHHLYPHRPAFTASSMRTADTRIALADPHPPPPSHGCASRPCFAPISPSFSALPCMRCAPVRRGISAYTPVLLPLVHPPHRPQTLTDQFPPRAGAAVVAILIWVHVCHTLSYISIAKIPLYHTLPKQLISSSTRHRANEPVFFSHLSTAVSLLQKIF